MALLLKKNNKQMSVELFILKKNIRSRSELLIIIHCLEVSCKEDQITSSVVCKNVLYQNAKYVNSRIYY